MLRKRVASGLRRNVIEFRLAAAMVAVGAPATLTGVALHTLSGPGTPALIIGLSLFITGLVMLGSRSRRPLG
ncbi:hypothetical protein [Streptomyces sp. NBC_00347]|uniref:hypothetical protein n=1 Tax=Streptomyces sp. NBC_00347 TaxID=2975721 RepID=UPI00225139FD|nr:hypothetical protein [Streptomyces sp. NBC_00347]MCX5124611.1 hypothetical protein [Streptomyces sp. NBC_00347]